MTPTEHFILAEKLAKVEAERDQLRAAFEALCEKWLGFHKYESGPIVSMLDELNAILVDNGSAALREHDAKMWDDTHDFVCPQGRFCSAHRNPYRDTAGGTDIVRGERTGGWVTCRRDGKGWRHTVSETCPGCSDERHTP